MWEAADVQWWWRRPRATDELALPVWFDEFGPVPWCEPPVMSEVCSCQSTST
jgi:hypothetical protein